mmetsp:Transcript_28021/g.75688  ORF Transcript_28021/g.75688 Transcript_28021/m.75688 type:complete len:207 (+) Transcript_28021:141-761(+)
MAAPTTKTALLVKAMAWATWMRGHWLLHGTLILRHTACPPSPCMRFGRSSCTNEQLPTPLPQPELQRMLPPVSLTTPNVLRIPMRAIVPPPSVAPYPDRHNQHQPQVTLKLDRQNRHTNTTTNPACLEACSSSTPHKQSTTPQDPTVPPPLCTRPALLSRIKLCTCVSISGLMVWAACIRASLPRSAVSRAPLALLVPLSAGPKMP